MCQPYGWLIDEDNILTKPLVVSGRQWSWTASQQARHKGTSFQTAAVANHSHFMTSQSSQQKKTNTRLSHTVHVAVGLLSK